MAQGLLKKATAPKKSSTTKGGGVTKRGSRLINPKNTKLIKQAKINKKFTSGLTAQTERMLGQRAGHLEMLGQGKKKSTTGEGAAKTKHGKKNSGKKT